MKNDEKNTRTLIGYKLSSYDASYVETTFHVTTYVTDRGCTLEITDVNSGMTFIVNEGSIK